MTQDDVMELEMDELNQHECMAPLTSLIKHMQRNVIAPKGEEVFPPIVRFLSVSSLMSL